VVVTQTGRSIGGPVEDYAPEWEALTGGKWSYNSLPLENCLRKSSPPSKQAQLITMFSSSGRLGGGLHGARLPGTDFRRPWIALTPRTSSRFYGERITAWGPTVYALPYDGDGHMLYYRKDLVAPDSPYAAEFKAKYGYPLAEPVTWSQYYDIAEFFNKREVETAGAKAVIYAWPKPSGAMPRATGYSCLTRPAMPRCPVTPVLL